MTKRTADWKCRAVEQHARLRPRTLQPLLQRVTRVAANASDEKSTRRRELLHALGTAEALRRHGHSPRPAFARALLRGYALDVAEAGAGQPIFGQPAPLATAGELVSMRLRRAAAVAAARWANASIGGGLAGVVGGTGGGLILMAAPGSVASFAVVPVLGLIGGCCGAAGGAGVGAGLSVAESIVRSRRAFPLFCGAAFGGGVDGSLCSGLGRES